MTQDDLAHNLPIFSVGEISQNLKRTVEAAFARVRVRGEISGFKRAASGHMYMTLKDADAVIDGVCWRGSAGRLGLAPEDGMEVIATGRLTTYPGRSKYQIVIDAMELAGEGALLKLLEDRRKKLAAEGLFDAARKKPLPYLPRVIGVVTSPTGAVIRDILHRLADRFPAHVLLWPVLVQGEGAAEQIAHAITGFDNLPSGGTVPRPDLIIAARGGGSLEDLWAFNEEIVVRAASDCTIPLISAVGHETDTTLIDYAADQRAPTPTAAAEIAVPVRLELLAQINDDGARLVQGMTRLISDRRTRLEGLARGLPNPLHILEDQAQRLDDRAERLRLGLRSHVDARAAQLATTGARLTHPRQLISQKTDRFAAQNRALKIAYKAACDKAEARLQRAGALLEAYSYGRILDQGFALVTDATGNLVAQSKGLRAGDALTLGFKDGQVGVAVTGGAAPKKTPKRKPGGDRQGSLL